MESWNNVISLEKRKRKKMPAVRILKI